MRKGGGNSVCIVVVVVDAGAEEVGVNVRVSVRVVFAGG